MTPEVKEIIKEFVTDEMIQCALYERICEYFSNNYESLLENRIYREAERLAREKGDEYIMNAIEKVLEGKVRVDDGWGHVSEMGSFEDLVRSRISKQLSDGWNVERKVREAVDQKIKKICDNVRKNHVDNMAEQVIKRLASDEEKRRDQNDTL